MGRTLLRSKGGNSLPLLLCLFANLEDERELRRQPGARNVRCIANTGIGARQTDSGVVTPSDTQGKAVLRVEE